MAKHLTNSDKILQSVLYDQKLCKQYNYEPSDYETISDALVSDMPIVCAVAKIIDGNENKSTEREIFNEVSNYLKNNI